MARSDPLEGLRGTAFRLPDARRRGAGRKRFDARHLHRPFVGVRAFERPDTVLALCRQYLPKMAEHEFFSHRTAALLHGMWLPLRVERDLRLDVAVVKPRRAPRDLAVRGHHLVDRSALVWTVDGMRVSNPLETYLQLAQVLGDDDLVVAGESLLTPRHLNRRSMLERIAAASGDPARRSHGRLARVAPRLRPRSRSAQETRTRLLLVAHGLAEPAINMALTLPDGSTIEGDLVYEAERVWIEVEGDQHRTDRVQWRRDVVRYERLADLGWRVIRVSADDVRLRPEETVARVRRALARER